MKRSTSICTLALLSGLSPAGCSSPLGEEMSTRSKLDPAGCQVFDAFKGRVLSRDELVAIDDDVVRGLVGSGTCPKSYAEIKLKLDASPTVSPASCQRHAPISEMAALGAANPRWRMLAYRDPTLCGPGDDPDNAQRLSEHGFAFGFPTVPPSGDVSGQPVDIIVRGDDQDTTHQQLHFWALDSGTWTYMGSTHDMLREGYACNDQGGCVPKAASKSKCASCHVDGALAVRSFGGPWAGFKLVGDNQLPGSEVITAANRAHLGEGASLYGAFNLINNSNIVLQRERKATLAKVSTKEMLRPLFCTTDVLFEAENQQTSRVFLDPFVFEAFDRVSVAYGPEHHFRDSLTGIPLRDDRGRLITRAATELVPTPFLYTFHLGFGYRDLFDRDFVLDVLSIDPTRALFSKDRCALLEYAPDGPAALTADLTAGFLAKLSGAADPVAVAFRAALADRKDADKHRKAARDFVAVCKARPAQEFNTDLGRYAAHLRHQARRLVATNPDGVVRGLAPIELVAYDGEPDQDIAFDPITCQLGARN